MFAPLHGVIYFVINFLKAVFSGLKFAEHYIILYLKEYVNSKRTIGFTNA